MKFVLLIVWILTFLDFSYANDQYQKVIGCTLFPYQNPENICYEKEKIKLDHKDEVRTETTNFQNLRFSPYYRYLSLVNRHGVLGSTFIGAGGSLSFNSSPPSAWSKILGIQYAEGDIFNQRHLEEDHFNDLSVYGLVRRTAMLTAKIKVFYSLGLGLRAQALKSTSSTSYWQGVRGLAVFDIGLQRQWLKTQWSLSWQMGQGVLKEFLVKKSINDAQTSSEFDQIRQATHFSLSLSLLLW